MKVILTAFQGKLRSEPMDWPEGREPRIKMLMDIDTLKTMRTELDASVFESTRVLGEFVAAGRFAVLEDGQTAEEYVLVKVYQ